MGETTQVAFRLPTDLVERLDRHLERVRLRTPGIGITRADVVRNLLSVGLDREEAAEAEAKAPSVPAGQERKRPAKAEKTYPRIRVKR
jgi:hypothetical protein